MFRRVVHAEPKRERGVTPIAPPQALLFNVEIHGLGLTREATTAAIYRRDT
jgi:hypothetical protein